MPRLAERFYERITNGEDVRACADIPEAACREVPGNFLRQLLVMSGTKIGDILVNAKTILPWFLSALGAPVAMVAWLVPLRESLSMLPQLMIAGYVRRLPRRKYVWILGGSMQAMAAGAMGVISLALSGWAAGWGLLICLAVFSLARGLCSVAGKDVLGKTVPKKRRGRLNGLAAGVSGVAAIGLGLGVWALLRAQDDATWFAWPLFLAAGLWIAASILYSTIREQPGETGGGQSAVGAAFKALSLLRIDAPFRRFVTTRALLLGSALCAPYFVVLAREHGTAGLHTLGAFVLAGGLAAAISAPIWGWFADYSSRRVLQCASALAATTGILVFLVVWRDWPSARWSLTYPAAFFLLSISHSGVRVGRKTYLVDLAGGNKRTDYVAVSNTVIGVILLFTGSVSALSSFLAPEWIILGLSGLGVVGSGLAGGLPET